MSLEGSPGLAEFRESVDERATIFWHVRTVPFIEFVVTDKKGTTGSLIKKLLEDERLSVYVLDGLTGEPCFGTDYMKTTIKVFRKAMQKTDLQHASWMAELGERTTLGDYNLNGVKAIQNERIYIPLVALKVDDDVLRSRNSRRFLQEVNRIDIPNEILRYAKSTKMRSQRRKFFGRLWVGRGLVSVGGTKASQAVLKPTGGFSPAIRELFNLSSRKSPAKVP